jgi:hypothetical protein
VVGYPVRRVTLNIKITQVIQQLVNNILADSLPEKFKAQKICININHGEETPVIFLEQITSSGLLPLLYKYGQTQAQPWHAELQARCRVIAFHNLKFQVEMEHLIQASKKHELTWLPWKGPALALQIYGDTALRQFNDLDFLVSDHELNRSLQILLNEGYTLLSPHDQHPHLLPLDQRCSFELFHAERQIRLDLTIKLIPLSGSRHQVRDMLERSQPSPEKRPYLQLQTS